MEVNINQIYSEVIHKSRYARYLPDLKRRENWSETINRYNDFWVNNLDGCNLYDGHFKQSLTELKQAIHRMDVMPSMRSLMTAGPALERDNVCAYNCSYVSIDKINKFSEILYILMCGTGVGFSVEDKYICKLPEIPEKLYKTDTVIVVSDTKIGWAKAYRELLVILYSGLIPKWDLSRLRPAGAPLKTFGGRSSGPEPLEKLFNMTVTMFKNAINRRLYPIECHDLICHIGNCVVVGGVRRSALISLSDLGDKDMRDAKSGSWWIIEPQRSLANNSAVFDIKPTLPVFLDEWQALYQSQSGERGIFNRDMAIKKCKDIGRDVIQPNGDKWEFGTNPCGEIILRPQEFCNLSELVGRLNDDYDVLAEKVRLSTIIGTLQSSLTNFKYLSKEWKKNCEDERLLGVSITGICDNPLLYDISTIAKRNNLADMLQELKGIARKTNKEYADRLGIKESAAITTIKPSGCCSLSTQIKTTKGIKTMLEIFVEQGITIHNLKDDTWYDLKQPIFVYDENDDIQEVTKLYCNGVKEVCEIEFEDGNVYYLTGNHKLKTVNGEWKRVDELTERDDIISF